MKTLTQKINYSIEAKKSNFLAFLMPYCDFEKEMKSLRQDHPKAVHFVYAYRFVEQGRIVERFSDDGEPKGSSGMPVLNVLIGYNLVNIAVIVVRYFGGILLGVGGLVRAYTQSVVECIKKADNDFFVDFLQKKTFDFKCSYPLLERVKYFAKQRGIEICDQKFLNDGVEMILSGCNEDVESFLHQSKEGFRR